jgi:hypothetical protein
MTTPIDGQGDPKRFSDFLIKDYELKIRYLTDHMQRMWTRFNYFVGIESAITGGKFIFGDGKPSNELAAIAAILSLIWYVMGAEDRFLVRLYRKQVADAAALMVGSVWSTSLGPYRHVGEVEESATTLHNEVSGWRLEFLSTTRLAAWIPLIVFLGWLGVLIVQCQP